MPEGIQTGSDESRNPFGGDFDETVLNPEFQQELRQTPELTQEVFEGFTKKGFLSLSKMVEKSKKPKDWDEWEMGTYEPDKSSLYQAYREMGLDPFQTRHKESNDVQFLMSVLLGTGNKKDALLGKGINVLEIAGKNGEEAKWPSASGFEQTGANYLGTDIKVDETDNKIFQDTSHKKQKFEVMELDATDMGKSLAERKFEIIYACAFFGFPTSWIAESKHTDTKNIEREILVQFDKHLKDGGLLLIVNREWPNLSILESMGYEVINYEHGSEFCIARKLSKNEIGAVVPDLQENQETTENN